MALWQLDVFGSEHDVHETHSRPAAANLANRPWALQPLLARRGVDIPLLAEILGVDETALWRRMAWQLDDWEADQYAIGVGLHPCEVWGWAWHEAVLDQPSEQLDLFDSMKGSS